MDRTAVSQEIRFERYTVQLAARQLLVDGEPAKLGARAFDVLVALIERRDRTVSKDELLQAVWPGLVVEENNLQVHISALRKLLGPQAIATIPGRGYRFAAEPLSGAPRPPDAPIGFPALATAPGNLPPGAPVLIGREADIAALAALVREQRLVSIVGAGGIGKTRLAQAVAHRLRDVWPEGVWLVQMAPLNDPELLAAAVAQVLGAKLPGRGQALDELVGALAGRRALLVLDNCEHLVGAVSRFAAAVLERQPTVHLLVTSQELLRVVGEHLFRVGPLAVPDGSGVAAARSASAVALFVERARALLPGFALDEDNVADVVDVCRRLDGLPLAIELAAARVPLLGTAGVRSRLDQRLRVLTAGARTAVRRHQTLRELLDWSHGLLDSHERVVFRRVGVFTGSFSLPAALHAIVDERLDEWAVLDHLGTLVDKSLLVAELGEPPRYRLLETARAYALERLQEASETDKLRERHARAMLQVYQREHERRWTDPSQDREARCRPDLDNLRAALDWAEQSPHAALHVELAAVSSWVFGCTAQRLEGLRRCAAALARVGRDTPPVSEARLALAWAERSWPNVEPAEMAAIDRSIELFRACGDDLGLLDALSHKAKATAIVGDTGRSAQALAQAEALRRPDWPASTQWVLLTMRGFLLAYEARMEEALVVCRELLTLAQALGDRGKVHLSLHYTEQVSGGAGHFEESAKIGRELLAAARREPFGGTYATTLSNHAMALVEIGLVDEALPLAREAVTLQAADGTLWIVLDLFARLALLAGRPDDAARVLGLSELRYRSIGGRRQYNEARQHDVVLQALLKQFGSGELHRLMSEGEMLGDEQAARMALGDR